MIVSCLSTESFNIAAFDQFGNLLEFSSEILKTDDNNLIFFNYFIFKPNIIVNKLNNFLTNLKEKFDIKLNNLNWISILENNFFENCLEEISLNNTKNIYQLRNHLIQTQSIENFTYICACHFSLLIQFLTISKITKLNLICLTSAFSAHANYFFYLKNLLRTQNDYLNLSTNDFFIASKKLEDQLVKLLDNNKVFLNKTLNVDFISLNAGYYAIQKQ